MSKSSAIAVVSATLSARLNKVIDASTGINADVWHTRPGTAGTNKVGVHLFLYMITPNAALRNNDLPVRDAKGKITQQPTSAIDLHYLLSFVGEDALHQPQLMLGAVTVDLHANSVLTPTEIRETVADQNISLLLKDSRLDQQIERVRLTSEAINLEEFSKLWSVFFQTQYLLSVAYKASVVLLEADEVTPEPARVRRPDVWSSPLPPMLDSLRPQVAGPGARLTLRGRGLRSTVVRFSASDGTSITASPVLVLDDRLDVDLPSTLRAGLVGVQVVATQESSSGDSTHTFELESGPLPFTLAPQIVDAGLVPLVSISAAPGAKISIDIVPPLGPSQTPEVLVGSRRLVPTLTDLGPNPPKATLTFTLPNDGSLVSGKSYPLRVVVGRAQSLVGEDGPISFKPRLEVP